MSKSKLTEEGLLTELRFMHDQASGILDSVCTREPSNHRDVVYKEIVKIIKLWYEFNLWDLKVGEVIDD